MSKLMRFIKDEEGVTAIEYGIIAALIIVVCLGTIATVGTNLSGVFGTVGGKLSSGT